MFLREDLILILSFRNELMTIIVACKLTSTYRQLFVICFFQQGGRKVEFSGEPKVKADIYLIIQRYFLIHELHLDR